MASSLVSAIDGLEDLLVASTTFMGSIDLPTEQRVRDERIMLEALTDENDKLISKLPAAALLEADHAWSMLSHGPGIETGASGTITLLLAKPTTDARVLKKARREFTNWASTIVDEIMDQVATGNYYQFAGATLNQRAVRPPRAERSVPGEDWWWCSYDFRWGFDE